MAAKKPMTIDDLWAIERLGAPSVSPDGAQAVVALTRFSMDANSSQSSLWLLSTLGGRPRRLTQAGEKDGSPRWSPHPRGRGRQAGELIAFTAKRVHGGVKDTESQLYLIAPDGGEAWRAADVATGVEAFRWAPDGRRLVLVSWVWPELSGVKAQARRYKAWKERKDTGYATSEAQYRHWDHNLPQGRVPHLHLLELGAASAPGKVRDLFEGTTFELPRGGPGVEHFDISPDGSSVVFAFDPAPEKRQDGRRALAEMDIATRQVQVIVQDAGWDLSGPCYSPDGQRIAFTASHQAVKHTMPTQLAVWERESHTWDVVSAEWDHAVRDPLHWEDDGQALLFTAEEKGCTHLWRFDLPDRRAEVVVRGGSVSGFDKSSGTLVTVADSVMHPARAHAHAPGETPLRLESFNDALLARLDLGRAEAVWLKGASAAALAKDATGGTGGTAVTGAAEGDDVQMWVVHPPAFDARKKYPALHCIHGGPHTGPGDNWHYRWNMHLFAAQGFVVASVNYHGSSGFGQAFLDSITHRWGELELQDIEAGTDWLLARPYIDSRRIFASGGSYGGFMVAWMNGHLSNQSPGRYQAYVCHAGCYDWVAMFADDAWAWHAKELGHWYWDDLARVQAQSPMAFAGTMSTPTLVIHGALDYRVPDAQGLAFYNTLKARGVDSRLLWFPDENHWILKPQNSRLWHAEFFAWLARHDPGTRRRRSNPRA